jgi:hypothetical protein
MKKEPFKFIYEHLLRKYMNGLDYIRNNPNLTPQEVSEHYATLKDLREVERRLNE